MQSPEEEHAEGGPFTDDQPPAPDAFHVPRHVLYLVMAAILVVVAAYAIVGHLIDELARDFTDWALGLELEDKNVLEEDPEDWRLGSLERPEGQFSPAVEHQDCDSLRGLPGMEVCTVLPWATQHPSVSIQDERSS
ncbi:small integral membrane protein 44 [Paroedura picta]|uniref:small integral membrane protein 44 n=1 Tax=Paroedura picta TaxID=143630 RepID=UPI00101508FD